MRCRRDLRITSRCARIGRLRGVMVMDLSLMILSRGQMKTLTFQVTKRTRSMRKRRRE